VLQILSLSDAEKEGYARLLFPANSAVAPEFVNVGLVVLNTCFLGKPDLQEINCALRTHSVQLLGSYLYSPRFFSQTRRFLQS
jgi:hypothetical protein